MHGAPTHTHTHTPRPWKMKNGWTWKSSLHLLPPNLCAVLELGKAKEHLLQRYLAHTIVFNVVFLFGGLQSTKHLDRQQRRWRGESTETFNGSHL